jgi:hypothetical protein
MKTVTAKELNRAYIELFPGENRDDAECERIMGNWLRRYEEGPEKALAFSNWQGKVTKAFFHALRLKQPKTKQGMIEALRIAP